jgi:hypothetical protein
VSKDIDIDLKLIHNRSGAQRQIKAVRYIHRSFVLSWPMMGYLELKKHQDGRWTSNPKSLLRDWSLLVESIKQLEDSISVLETERLLEQKRARGYAV